MFKRADEALGAGAADVGEGRRADLYGMRQGVMRAHACIDQRVDDHLTGKG